MLITITDPDVLRQYGWGKDGKPVPSYVSAVEGLWQAWALSEMRKEGDPWPILRNETET